MDRGEVYLGCIGTRVQNATFNAAYRLNCLAIAWTSEVVQIMGQNPKTIPGTPNPQPWMTIDKIVW